MSEWRSCDNCRIKERCKPAEECLNKSDPFWWLPIPCKNCGGALSEKRYHNGKAYRHCYACHAEFYIGEEKQ